MSSLVLFSCDIKSERTSLQEVLACYTIHSTNMELSCGPDEPSYHLPKQDLPPYTRQRLSSEAEFWAKNFSQ